MASSSGTQKRKRSSSGDIDPSNILPVTEKRTKGTTPPRSASFESAADAAVAQLEKNGLSEEVIVRAFRRMKRPSRQTPSDLTSHRPLQEGNDPTYLCFRPQHAVPHIPVILLFEPLSKFAVNLETIAITDDDVSFAQKFGNDIHSKEYVADHKAKVFSMVSEIGRNFLPYKFFQDGSTMDGAGLALATFACCVWLEYKAEPGKSGDPFFQVLNYVLKSADSPDEQTYGVALCVSGPYLEVLAVTVVGEKVWAEPLGIFQCYGRFEALKATARVWASIRQFTRDYESVEKFTSDPVPWCLRNCLDLQCLHERKLNYMYKNSQGQREFAKFVESYCNEAHTAWMPYVPQFLGTEAIAGKWMLVRMEYLSQEMGWRPAAEIVKDALTDSDPNHFAKIKSCIVQGVQRGHTQGFVHGDMRLPNILLRKSDENEADGFPKYDVRLLDFDWSGRSDVAKYPRRLNRQIDWPPGATFGAFISEGHDMWFVNCLKQQLESCT